MNGKYSFLQLRERKLPEIRIWNSIFKAEKNQIVDVQGDRGGLKPICQWRGGSQISVGCLERERGVIFNFPHGWWGYGSFLQ